MGPPWGPGAPPSDPRAPEDPAGQAASARLAPLAWPAFRRPTKTPGRPAGTGWRPAPA